jgi:multidrug resistance protein, MATE family
MSSSEGGVVIFRLLCSLTTASTLFLSRLLYCILSTFSHQKGERRFAKSCVEPVQSLPTCGIPSATETAMAPTRDELNSQSALHSASRRSFGEEEAATYQNEVVSETSETTALLGYLEQPYQGEYRPKIVENGLDESRASGTMQEKWQWEAKVLATYSRSLVLTFMLQYSLLVATILSVGRIGKIELGAVSIASMAANITGFAVYQGLATSLDTLCAQAYGSGNKTLVGLQMQRMVFLLWMMTVPIGIVWFSGTRILEAIIPEKEVAALAGLFLKIILVGSPGYAAFECGKRFVQAQGLFSATFYVLLFCAPLNAFLNWLFVWVSAYRT